MSSPTAVAVFAGLMLASTASIGGGLRGHYYDDVNFTWHKCSRVDASVDFDWSSNGPGCSVASDTYSVRWTGTVEPRYSETYSFTTLSDDGVRLYVDDKLVIDQWQDQGPTEHSGSVLLKSGVKHRIQLDYYNRYWTGSVRLFWSSASQPKEIVPSSRLSADDDVCNAPTTVTDFGVNGSIGAQWNAATRTLAYGRPGTDGYYDIYLSDGDGRNERRLTYPAWQENRHQFPAAWHPSGKYLAVLIEKPVHKGSSTDAIPGYGAFTDYWLITPDGAKAWKVVEIPDDYNYAITHAAFSPDGTKFIWTQRYMAPRFLDMNLAAGAYTFNVSDFVDGPTPHLADTRKFEPGGVPQGGEIESISKDNSTIAFYSTLASKNLFASRIYTLNIKTNELKELTTESWAQAPNFTPDGKSIVYMTGAQADIFPFRLQGADWWIMSTDGTNKRRLTFMNVRNHPQSVNDFRLAGSLTFTSNTSFLGGVMTQSLGLVGKTVKVVCD